MENEVFFLLPQNEKRPNGTLFVFQIIRVLTLPNTDYPQYLL